MRMKRFLLVLTILMLLQSITVLAGDSVHIEDGLSYTIINEDGTVAEQGTIPDKQTRAFWSGVTLQNAQSVIFGNPDGLYCLGGSAATVGVSLSRSARIQYHLINSAGAGVLSATQMGINLSVSGIVPSTDRYRGLVTNYSSDPVTITGFSITF